LASSKGEINIKSFTSAENNFSKSFGPELIQINERGFFFGGVSREIVKT